MLPVSPFPPRLQTRQRTHLLLLLLLCWIAASLSALKLRRLQLLWRLLPSQTPPPDLLALTKTKTRCTPPISSCSSLLLGPQGV